MNNIIPEHLRYKPELLAPFKTAVDQGFFREAAEIMADTIEKILELEQAERVLIRKVKPDRKQPLEWLALMETVWRMACCGHVPAGATGLAFELEGSSREEFTTWVAEWIERGRELLKHDEESLDA